MADARMGYGPFPAQVEFFRRKINVPSKRWDDLTHGDHAHGFMVAGLTRMTMLDEVRQAMMAAIENGESYDKFRARFDKTLGKAWSTLRGGETEKGRAWRTRLIYQTNLRTSYMAGRWETLQKFPYLKYQHNTVDNPRESHQALDDKIIATRDPWWDTHYPPNGWMCRCTVTGVSEARLRALRGENAQPDEPPPTDPKDQPPEWAYHVGKASRSMAAAERFGQKVMQLPPAWRKAALDDAQGRQVDWFNDFPSFIDRAVSEIAEGKPRSIGAATPVAFMPNPVWEQLAAGVTPDGHKFSPTRVTPLIASSDRALYHAMRGGQKWAGREEVLQAVIAQARNLPEWANHPDTLWFLNKSPFQLVLARKLDDTRYMTVPVSLGGIDRKAKEKVELNWLQTFEVETIDKMKHLKLLYGNP